MRHFLFILSILTYFSVALENAFTQQPLGTAILTEDWGINDKQEGPLKEEIQTLSFGGDGDGKVLIGFTLDPSLVSRLTPGCIAVLEADVTAIALEMGSAEGEIPDAKLVAYPLKNGEWRERSGSEWRSLQPSEDYDADKPLFSVDINLNQIVSTKRLKISFPIKEVKSFQQAGLSGILLALRGGESETSFRTIEVAGSANQKRIPLKISFFPKLR